MVGDPADLSCFLSPTLPMDSLGLSVDGCASLVSQHGLVQAVKLFKKSAWAGPTTLWNRKAWPFGACSAGHRDAVEASLAYMLGVERTAEPWLLAQSKSITLEFLLTVIAMLHFGLSSSDGIIQELGRKDPHAGQRTPAELLGDERWAGRTLLDLVTQLPISSGAGHFGQVQNRLKGLGLVPTQGLTKTFFFARLVRATALLLEYAQGADESLQTPAPGSGVRAQLAWRFPHLGATFLDELLSPGMESFVPPTAGGEFALAGVCAGPAFFDSQGSDDSVADSAEEAVACLEQYGLDLTGTFVEINILARGEADHHHCLYAFAGALLGIDVEASEGSHTTVLVWVPTLNKFHPCPIMMASADGYKGERLVARPAGSVTSVLDATNREGLSYFRPLATLGEVIDVLGEEPTGLVTPVNRLRRELQGGGRPPSMVHGPKGSHDDDLRANLMGDKWLAEQESLREASLPGRSGGGTGLRDTAMYEKVTFQPMLADGAFPGHSEDGPGLREGPHRPAWPAPSVGTGVGSARGSEEGRSNVARGMPDALTGGFQPGRPPRALFPRPVPVQPQASWSGHDDSSRQRERSGGLTYDTDPDYFRQERGGHPTRLLFDPERGRSRPAIPEVAYQGWRPAVPDDASFTTVGPNAPYPAARRCMANNVMTGMACHARILPGSAFCTSCGAQAEAPLSCPQCGLRRNALLPPTDTFCQGCGANTVSLCPPDPAVALQAEMSAKMVHAVHKLEDALRAPESKKEETFGAKTLSKDLSEGLAFMRYLYRAAESFAAGAEIYGFGLGSKPLARAALYEWLQTQANPVPLQTGRKPVFDWTNSICYRLMAMDIHLIKLTELFSTRWTDVVHLEGRQGIGDTVADAVDPKGITEGMRAQVMEAAENKAILYSSMYGNDAGDSYLRGLRQLMDLNLQDSVLHPLAVLVELSYKLELLWREEQKAAFRVRDSNLFKFSSLALQVARRTGIPAPQFEADPAGDMVHFMYFQALQREQMSMVRDFASRRGKRDPTTMRARGDSTHADESGALVVAGGESDDMASPLDLHLAPQAGAMSYPHMGSSLQVDAAAAALSLRGGPPMPAPRSNFHPAAGLGAAPSRATHASSHAPGVSAVRGTACRCPNDIWVAAIAEETIPQRAIESQRGFGSNSGAAKLAPVCLKNQSHDGCPLPENICGKSHGVVDPKDLTTAQMALITTWGGHKLLARITSVQHRMAMASVLANIHREEADGKVVASRNSAQQSDYQKKTSPLDRVYGGGVDAGDVLFAQTGYSAEEEYQARHPRWAGWPETENPSASLFRGAPAANGEVEQGDPEDAFTERDTAVYDPSSRLYRGRPCEHMAAAPSSHVEEATAAPTVTLVVENASLTNRQEPPPELTHTRSHGTSSPHIQVAVTQGGDDVGRYAVLEPGESARFVMHADAAPEQAGRALRELRTTYGLPVSVMPTRVTCEVWVCPSPGRQVQWSLSQVRLVERREPTAGDEAEQVVVDLVGEHQAITCTAVTAGWAGEPAFPAVSLEGAWGALDPGASTSSASGPAHGSGSGHRPSQWWQDVWLSVDPLTHEPQPMTADRHARYLQYLRAIELRDQYVAGTADGVEPEQPRLAAVAPEAEPCPAAPEAEPDPVPDELLAAALLGTIANQCPFTTVAMRQLKKWHRRVFETFMRSAYGTAECRCPHSTNMTFEQLLRHAESMGRTTTGPPAELHARLHDYLLRREVGRHLAGTSQPLAKVTDPRGSEAASGGGHKASGAAGPANAHAVGEKTSFRQLEVVTPFSPKKSPYSYRFAGQSDEAADCWTVVNAPGPALQSRLVHSPAGWSPRLVHPVQSGVRGARAALAVTLREDPSPNLERSRAAEPTPETRFLLEQGQQVSIACGPRALLVSVEPDDGYVVDANDVPWYPLMDIDLMGCTAGALPGAQVPTLGVELWEEMPVAVARDTSGGPKIIITLVTHRVPHDHALNMHQDAEGRQIGFMQGMRQVTDASLLTWDGTRSSYQFENYGGPNFDSGRAAGHYPGWSRSGTYSGSGTGSGSGATAAADAAAIDHPPAEIDWAAMQATAEARCDRRRAEFPATMAAIESRAVQRDAAEAKPSCRAALELLRGRRLQPQAASDRLPALGSPRSAFSAPARVLRIAPFGIAISPSAYQSVRECVLNLAGDQGEADWSDAGAESPASPAEGPRSPSAPAQTEPDNSPDSPSPAQPRASPSTPGSPNAATRPSEVAPRLGSPAVSSSSGAVSPHREAGDAAQGADDCTSVRRSSRRVPRQVHPVGSTVAVRDADSGLAQYDWAQVASYNPVSQLYSVRWMFASDRPYYSRQVQSQDITTEAQAVRQLQRCHFSPASAAATQQIYRRNALAAAARRYAGASLELHGVVLDPVQATPNATAQAFVVGSPPEKQHFQYTAWPVLAYSPRASILGQPATIYDYGDTIGGLHGMCVPIHVAMGQGTDPAALRRDTVLRAEHALARFPTLPPKAQRMLKVLVQDAALGQGVSPLVYQLLHGGKRALALVQADGTPATLMWPGGATPPPDWATQLRRHPPVELLARPAHVQLVQRAGDVAVPWAELVASGDAVFFDLKVGVTLAEAAAVDALQAITSAGDDEVTLNTSIIDELHPDGRSLPMQAPGDTGEDGTLDWLEVYGEMEKAKTGGDKYDHRWGFMADPKMYMHQRELAKAAADQVLEDPAHKGLLGATLTDPTPPTTKEGRSFALVYRKLTSELKGGKDCFQLTIKHCDSWRKSSGSLEAMARDLASLTPGQISEEVHPERLKTELTGKVHKALLDEVVEQTTTGVKWAWRKNCERVRQRGANLPSAADKHREVFDEVRKLVAEGRAFVFSPALLPEMAEDKVRISPFGLVPKSHLGKPTGKSRPINHGSWPKGRSLNDHTLVEYELPVVLPKFSDFARTNLYLRYRFPSARILGKKDDVNGAFYHCWLDPRYVGQLAAEIAGHTVVNLTEFFGHSAAPTKYGSRGRCIDLCSNADYWLHAPPQATPTEWSLVAAPESECTQETFTSDTYVDDGYIQAPNIRAHDGAEVCRLAAESYEKWMCRLCGPDAVSTKNPEELVWAPAQVVCGLIQFAEAGGMGLPEGKRCQLLEILSKPVYHPKPLVFASSNPTVPVGQGPITLGEVRSDLGTLVHAVNAEPNLFPFCVFLTRCLAGRGSAEDPATVVSPVLQGEAPETAWREFYDDAATLRLTVSTSQAAHVLFTTPYEVILPPDEAIMSPYVSGTTQIQGSDCSQNVVGGANITRRKRWRVLLPAHVRSHILASMEGIDLGPFQYTIGGGELGGGSINELKYVDGKYDITLGLIDNTGSKHQLDKHKAKNPVSRHMLKVLAFNRAIHKPVINYAYIWTHIHTYFDLISRSLDEQGVPIPEIDEEIYRWEREHGLVGMEWETVSQEHLDLVYPTPDLLEVPVTQATLKTLFEQAAQGHERCFSTRVADEERPKPLPLSQAVQVNQLMVDKPDLFPLPLDASRLPDAVAGLYSGSSRPKESGEPLTLTIGCCGGGGDALGGLAAGMKVMCVFDKDLKARDMVADMVNCPKQHRLGEFGKKDFDEESMPVTDVFSVGTPCPPYSILGIQLGSDDRRDLFIEIVKFVIRRKEMGKAYKCVLLEMVPGMLLCTAGQASYARAVAMLTEAGYDLGEELVTGNTTAPGPAGGRYIEVAPYDHGLPLNKVRHFTRAILKGSGFAACDVVNTRTPEHPESLGDILKPDHQVAASLFLPPGINLTPERDWPEGGGRSKRMPHTWARIQRGVGQPNFPFRCLHHGGSCYVILQSGNVPWVLTPQGSIRMLAVVECIELHGFPATYGAGYSRATILGWLGNCICPPVAQAVLSTFHRVTAGPAEQAQRPLSGVNRGPEAAGPPNQGTKEAKEAPEAERKVPGGREKEVSLKVPKAARRKGALGMIGPLIPIQYRYKKAQRMLAGHFCTVVTGLVHLDPVAQKAAAAMSTLEFLEVRAQLMKRFHLLENPQSVGVQLTPNQGMDAADSALRPLAGSTRPTIGDTRTALPPVDTSERRGKRREVFAAYSQATHCRMRAARAELSAMDLGTLSRKRYANNFNHYVEYCKLRGEVHTLDGRDKARDVNLLTDFAVWEHVMHGNKAGTIISKLYAIRYFTMELGCPDPLDDTPTLDRVMKGIKRRSASEKRKLPVTPEMLKLLMKRANMGKLRTRGVVTAIITAFFFLLRSSEYAAESRYTVGPHVIKRHHVRFLAQGAPVLNYREADQIEITIPSSKTDQSKVGYTRTHYKAEHELCPVTLIGEWMEATQGMPPAAPLFSFNEGNATESDCVTRSRVSKTLAAVATELGYPQGSVSSHSCRSGGATALIHAGVDRSVVQCVGRWSSDIFQIYSRFTAGLMSGVSTLMANANVTYTQGQSTE